MQITSKKFAFDRLHALVRAGYRPELGNVKDSGVIRLDHPRGTEAGAPDLVLNPDGSVYVLFNKSPVNTGQGDPNCIYADDDADKKNFQLFVQGIPSPKLHHTFGSMPIWEVTMKTFIYSLLAGFTIVFVLAMSWFIRFAIR
jgi:hypothetical protein